MNMRPVARCVTDGTTADAAVVPVTDPVPVHVAVVSSGSLGIQTVVVE